MIATGAEDSLWLEMMQEVLGGGEYTHRTHRIHTLRIYTHSEHTEYIHTQNTHPEHTEYVYTAVATFTQFTPL